MESETTGKQAVAVGVLDHMFGTDAGGIEISHHALGPLGQVVGGIGAGNGLSRGSGRGVYPNHLLERNGTQAEGVVVPQIVFNSEGKLGHILDALDIGGLDSGFFEFFLIKRDAFGYPIQGFLELFQLKLLDLLDWHAFVRFIPRHRLPPSQWSVSPGKPHKVRPGGTCTLWAAWQRSEFPSPGLVIMDGPIQRNMNNRFRGCWSLRHSPGSGVFCGIEAHVKRPEVHLHKGLFGCGAQGFFQILLGNG
jgi:hypothetical protein